MWRRNSKKHHPGSTCAFARGTKKKTTPTQKPKPTPKQQPTNKKASHKKTTEFVHSFTVLSIHSQFLCSPFQIWVSEPSRSWASSASTDEITGRQHSAGSRIKLLQSSHFPTHTPNWKLLIQRIYQSWEREHIQKWTTKNGIKQKNY